MQMNYNVFKNLELKVNEAEACLGTAQLLTKKKTGKTLSAAEVCFAEATDKLKELRPLLAMVETCMRGKQQANYATEENATGIQILHSNVKYIYTGVSM